MSIDDDFVPLKTIYGVHPPFENVDVDMEYWRNKIYNALQLPPGLFKKTQIAQLMESWESYE